jgi:hypothetical protein
MISIYMRIKLGVIIMKPNKLIDSFFRDNLMDFIVGAQFIVPNSLSPTSNLLLDHHISLSDSYGLGAR